ncbi:hypothetical protein OKA05_22485 [Luteolibacter arcticus]|uniref:Ig-like domain-containing protein n=1 Tax=Luteolibacter arcticus TaxID=1581411 RepID=A0ABT3GP96_9BACT|nr:hypothetical protein [Luteolibacter arcticus]MCW1925345.1 hypothetical protein [Luteolibacter arcticus]
MKCFSHAVRSRVLTSKLGSLVLLFQRSPIVQMLFPEAKLLGGAGLGEATKWVVATVAGLGAYDTVTGATEIVQTYPDENSQIVTGTAGVPLYFLFQVVGTPSNDKVSWSVSGLPPGLDHGDVPPPNPPTPYFHVISGTPTEEGSTTVTVTAYELQNQGGASFPQEFLFEIAPAIITNHPASVAIASGTKATLTVVGNPNGNTLTYRWYRGASGSTTNLAPGANTSSTYTTPNLTSATNYWVRVTRDGVAADSSTATVSIATVPTITTQPVSTTIPSGTTATLTVAASGTSPSIQWYRGTSPSMADPVAGATSTSFTTPALTTTTSYWARATNAAGGANSNTAIVTVNAPADPYGEWKASQFNATQLANPLVSGPTADPDADGITNQDEYIFGTPALTRDPSPLTIAVASGSNLSLGFTARQASGAGYAGKTRHYSLETRTDLGSGTWTPLSGFADIIGNNQPVTYSAPATPPRAFYSLRVWLTP